MYRGSVFIQSRNLVENGGLIVAKARHVYVELAGGTGAVSSSLMCYCLHDMLMYVTVKVARNYSCMASP